MIFYLLWCLGLKEGKNYADLLINIDSLSTSDEYRQVIESTLKSRNIEKIHFLDCSVPQTYYTNEEVEFFQSLEAKVHSWLLDGGWEQSDLDEIQRIRYEHQPSNLVCKLENGKYIDLLKQSSRARDLLVRYEKYLFDRTNLFNNRLSETKAKAEIAEEKNKELTAASIKDVAAIEQLTHLNNLLQTKEQHTKEQLEEALSIAQTAQVQADQLNQQLSHAHAQEQQTKERLQQALSLAQTAQVQVDQLNQQLSHAHAQEQQTKEQLQQALSLAQTMQVQADNQNNSYKKNMLDAIQNIKNKDITIENLRLENENLRVFNLKQSDSHKKQLENFYESYSWKITSPLRYLFKLAKPNK